MSSKRKVLAPKPRKHKPSPGKLRGKQASLPSASLMERVNAVLDIYFRSHPALSR